MFNFLWMLLLMIAAGLEAGGDALVRKGLHAAVPSDRLMFLTGGAAVLFSYGVVVNLPPWDFGRLLGVYVALFFVVAQVINRLAFGVSPGPGILVGGALILSGAAVMTFSRSA
jgi:small multidrug resistance family-3 protein